MSSRDVAVKLDPPTSCKGRQVSEKSHVAHANARAGSRLIGNHTSSRMHARGFRDRKYLCFLLYLSRSSSSFRPVHLSTPHCMHTTHQLMLTTPPPPYVRKAVCDPFSDLLDLDSWLQGERDAPSPLEPALDHFPDQPFHFCRPGSTRFQGLIVSRPSNLKDGQRLILRKNKIAEWQNCDYRA